MQEAGFLTKNRDKPFSNILSIGCSPFLYFFLFCLYRETLKDPTAGGALGAQAVGVVAYLFVNNSKSRNRFRKCGKVVRSTWSM